MSQIGIEKGLSLQEAKRRGVFAWPTWECAASIFPWTYDADEECYLLEGRVEVTPEGGEPVSFGAGDYVRFPAGMSCTWRVIEPVRKHYVFR
ncbi:protein of unknown function DUF861 cupin 3 [Alkalidesulfovibrio alkalitolerans DSM 16529]|jgi:uncharacterized cupin superfamily protein|uniref:(S)-ureidoglycine aminohydrolase cupin domain-containing protein n=1 Tax=Alkalidesulfovibrio alkalitolerans DSM 16529 TaxID=1121439 RepID=S7UK91_9BACT|nr:cupin domain-containing protein [Alkalidesulfovibrio alkalitolerans]EPR34229.1 protein of unknown function DUF861 cupin 3 [Alkalidesulfovibrio alkalitolerans DSM 16529]